MTLPTHVVTALLAVRHRAAIGAAAALVAGGALLAAGCSSSGMASGSSAPAAGGAAGRPAARQPATQQGGNALALAPLSGQSIIYTATLTVRTKDVSAAAARATRIAGAAGGYVSSEATRLNRAHPARSSVSMQLKIPVAAYPATLATLSSRLGKRISLSRQARDVTQTVADVTSRVASARAAIAQLRTLLKRAGSVGDLLQVQNQINQQEANLEALQSQQRSLARQTSYATVSLLLTTVPPPATHPAKHAGGFTAGLAAGWRALRAVISWLLTVAGAVLPFAAIVALVAFGGYRAWRWLARRRPGTDPAG